MRRRLHLIGSWPAATAEAAMREMLERAGPHLPYLPDGETGERRDWIVHIVEGLRGHPDLEVRREGGWTNYTDQLNFRVRKGHRLAGDSLDLRHVAPYLANRTAFEALRTERHLPELAFQVGIPGDFDMAMFTLGRAGPFTHRRAFTDATVAEIARIHREGGDGVVFQLEVPAELVLVAMAPPPVRRAMAARLGAGIAELARRSPAGARFGLHLCLGDLGHKALARLDDAGPLVLLANAAARRWPAGRPLEFVHAPLAAGEDPPPTDPAFYAPLEGLLLPVRTRLVAGFLHEGRTLDEHRAILGMIEARVGTEVDVAASCGLSRRGHDAAVATVERGVALCAG